MLKVRILYTGAVNLVSTDRHRVKNSLIAECTALATGQNVVSVWGVWNSDPGHNLTPAEANQCVPFK